MNPLCGLRIGALAIGLVVTAAAAEAQPAGCEPGKLAEKYPTLAGRTLKIGVDPQTPPYVMRDANNFDQLVGFDADLARATLDCIGVQHEFFIGGWSGLLPALIAGQIDLFWNNLYYTTERAKQVDYVVYMQAGTGALGRAGNPKGIDGMGDLCGTTVAVGLGTVEEPQVKAEDETCRAAGKDGVTMMTFPDVAAGVRLVQGERADIMLYDLALIDALVVGNPSEYGRAFKILSGFGIGVAVNEKEPELLKAVAEALTLIQTSGEQDAIFKRYTIDTALGMPAEVKTQ